MKNNKNKCLYDGFISKNGPASISVLEYRATFFFVLQRYSYSIEADIDSDDKTAQINKLV